MPGVGVARGSGELSLGFCVRLPVWKPPAAVCWGRPATSYAVIISRSGPMYSCGPTFAAAGSGLAVRSTEHILLALLEREAGTGVLADLGIDKPAVEGHITAALAAEA